MFKELRARVFITFVYYISVADFFMNVASAMGFPPGGSVLCWIQGNFTFYRCYNMLLVMFYFES